MTTSTKAAPTAAKKAAPTAAKKAAPTAAKKAAPTAAKKAAPAGPLRDLDKDAFKADVKALKASAGVALAHTFAHLSWTSTDTDPLTVMSKMSGNTRRNDAVAWLDSQGVIREPIPVQVATLVNALREAGAESAIVNRIAGHYGVGDDLI